jgi:hypothetical protein
MIQDRLPNNVGLEVWDDSCPSGYDRKGTNPDKIADMLRWQKCRHQRQVAIMICSWRGKTTYASPGGSINSCGNRKRWIDYAHRLRHSAGCSRNMDPQSMKFFGPADETLDRPYPALFALAVERDGKWCTTT